MYIPKRSTKHQSFINAITSLVFFILNFIIGIWFIPYLIKNIGVAAYGLVPLALSIVSYAGLVTISLNASVSRYLTIDLQRNDIETAKKT